MRKLVYVPIIHLRDGLSDTSSKREKKAKNSLKEVYREIHKEAISGFWDSIARYFDSLKVSDLKIYQEGLVAEGEIGLKIISEGEKKGNKNYEIVSRLISRGDRLMKTEDYFLVRKEHDFIVRINETKNFIKKIIATLNYKFHRNKLLRERDEFIAHTIDETLVEGETGVLFLGAHHEILSKLPEDIKIIELKEREKIKEYQDGFFTNKNKEKLNQLANYLMSPVEQLL